MEYGSETATEIFQRLERTADLIACHPDFHGKQDVVLRCSKEIEERYQQGTLTAEQRVKLLATLSLEGQLR